MKTFIAFNIEHLNRIKDLELRTLARSHRVYPLVCLFKDSDPRKASWPNTLFASDLEATEELKLRFQQAFAEVNLPVLFVNLAA